MQKDNIDNREQGVITKLRHYSSGKLLLWFLQ